MEQAVSKSPGAEQRQQGVDYANTFDWRNTADEVIKTYTNLVN
jgi:hypothetical protein